MRSITRFSIALFAALISFIIATIVTVFYYLPSDNNLNRTSVVKNRILYSVPEDATLNFTQLMSKLDLNCEEYQVITEDKYILNVVRVIGNTSKPVLLAHGLLDSADTFALRSNLSLVTALTAANYDVWAVNFRGNRYSRRHLELDPDGSEFWEFSFHEYGYYDLPAVIDFILSRTGQRSVSAVAHSIGGTAFLVMGSLRPEYNKKVKVLVAMAPICHMDHLKPPFAPLLVAEKILNSVLKLFGKNEVFGSYSHSLLVLQNVCSLKLLGKELCLKGGLFRLLGRDDGEINPEFLPVIFGHYPAGTSVKNMNHVAQLFIRKSFSQYSFGVIRNLLHYFFWKPPEYDLRKMDMKVALFFGRNDMMSRWEDGEGLRNDLPKVVEYQVLEREQMNHIDFVWGRNMNVYLFPRVLKVLDKYS